MKRRLLAVGKGLAGLLLGLVGLFAVLLIWPRAEAPLPQRHAATLFENARIIDVETATVSDPTDILVLAGKIAAIGQDPVVPVGARRIDLRGQWVMPGLWDMHSHSWQVSPQLHLPLQLASGVTAVRDMMGCPEPEDPLIACHADKQRWNQNAARGAMASPRFIGDASFYYEDPSLNQQAVRSRVSEDAATGIGMLKVYNRLPANAYDALVLAAREKGLPVVGHLPRDVPLDRAISAGQRSFEHGRIFIEGCFADAGRWRRGGLDKLDRPELLMLMLDQRDQAYCTAQMKRMSQSGAAFVPTLVTREEDARADEASFMNDPRLDLADPLSRWAYRDDAAATLKIYPDAEDRVLLDRALAQAKADALAAYRAGVLVLVGSDTIIAGPRLHDEMALLVDAGLSTGEVLRAATLNPARFMGLAHDYGTIEPGKRADLIILGANPLDDIRNTTKLAGVMLNGHFYDSQALQGLKRFVQGQASSPANWARMIWGFLTSPAGSSL